MIVDGENILKEWDEVCDAARQWGESIKDHKAKLIERADRRTRKEVCEDIAQRIVKERETTEGIRRIRTASSLSWTRGGEAHVGKELPATAAKAGYANQAQDG